jgi:hypothetical protein
MSHRSLPLVRALVLLTIGMSAAGAQQEPRKTPARMSVFAAAGFGASSLAGPGTTDNEPFAESISLGVDIRLHPRVSVAVEGGYSLLMGNGVYGRSRDENGLANIVLQQLEFPVTVRLHLRPLGLPVSIGGGMTLTQSLGCNAEQDAGFGSTYPCGDWPGGIVLFDAKGDWIETPPPYFASVSRRGASLLLTGSAALNRRIDLEARYQRGLSPALESRDGTLRMRVFTIGARFLIGPKPID